MPTDPRPTVAEALEALRLKRNAIIDGDSGSPKGFVGMWVAVPKGDFDALRAALPVLEAALAQPQRVREFFREHFDCRLTITPSAQGAGIHCWTHDVWCEV